MRIRITTDYEFPEDDDIKSLYDQGFNKKEVYESIEVMQKLSVESEFSKMGIEAEVTVECYDVDNFYNDAIYLGGCN